MMREMRGGKDVEASGSYNSLGLSFTGVTERGCGGVEVWRCGQNIYEKL